jgi:hypothetical protein
MIKLPASTFPVSSSLPVLENAFGMKERRLIIITKSLNLININIL